MRSLFRKELRSLRPFLALVLFFVVLNWVPSEAVQKVGGAPAPAGDPPTGTTSGKPAKGPSGLVGSSLAVPSGEPADGTGW